MSTETRVKKRDRVSKNQHLTNQIFEDLELYKNFCVGFGYKFREEDLYNMHTYPFQQYQKFTAGKKFKDQLSIDFLRFNR